MTYIERHRVDLQPVQARIDSLAPDLATLLDRVGTKNAILDRIFSDSLMLGKLSCVADPAAETTRTRDYFTTALHAMSGLFLAGEQTGNPIDYELCDRRFALKRTGPRRYHRAGNWLTCLWLAVVLRDHVRIAQLATTPIDVLRQAGSAYDPFMYSWVQALQSFFRHGESLEELFVATMQGADPENVAIASQEVLLDLLYPPIEMLYYVLRRDDERFTESLRRALVGHRRYWSTPERGTTSDGMVALAPLAISVLARQSRMAIEVESEYLPHHLLHGDWISAG